MENTTASPFVEWEICSKDYNTQQSLINDFCLLLDTHSYKRSEKYLTRFFIRLILFVIFILFVFSVCIFFFFRLEPFYFSFLTNLSFSRDQNGEKCSFFSECLNWTTEMILSSLIKWQMFRKKRKKANESKVEE